MINNNQCRSVSIIGAGAWGTTLADLLAKKGLDILLWCFEEQTVQDINSSKENKKFLPGIKLHKNITATADLEESFNNSKVIISVIPCQHIRNTYQDKGLVVSKDVMILSATKGIEKDTLKRPSEIIKELLKAENVAALSGPNLSKEIAQGLPAASVIASSDDNTAKILQEILNTEKFRIYTSDDVIGVELGGALKNVIAIAAGICDGLALGSNAKSALIVRGLAEIKRLGIAAGAKQGTFSGLSGIGDLITTCQSSLSRNHSVGEQLAKGKTLVEIQKSMNAIPEGVDTSVSALKLAERLEVEIPITREVYKVLLEGKKPAESIPSLMGRSLKSE
ncbi:MAG: NAD(P)H-dependent glycerol-3-phosphate dehydrogenase [Candidatus Margulisiibacteriota bacterium]